MVTNEERREVARELRELPIDMYEVLKSWGFEGIDTCCSDQTDYYLIHQAVFGCVPADHMHPCDYEELHMRLADLIEPGPQCPYYSDERHRCSIHDIEPEPEHTCHIVMVSPGEWECSACGGGIDWDSYDEGDLPNCNYCPNCGAKVVEK